MHEKAFLVTADYHFLKGVNRNELLRRYHSEAQKIEIVTPSNFISLLRACKLGRLSSAG
jgi:predicted nucleic acid-binding protein